VKEGFPKVNFIGIGAQKAATTWIFKCLEEHPDICVSNPKETFFFCEDDKFQRGAEYYKSFFLGCEERKITGEYTTSYLSTPGTAERIKKYYPDVQLIVCLRDPVKRAISTYNHLDFKNITKKLNFKEALVECPEIVEYGFYYRYLRNYFDLFPRENILVLIYEDIEKDPGEFIEKIYSFLGVDDEFVPKGVNSKVNTSAARSSSINKGINRLYLKKGNNFLMSRIIKFARRLGVNKYKIDATFKRNDYKNISEEEVQMLANIYKDDINNLKGLIKRDLSVWSNNK